jgi:hypothetical protein
MKKINFIILLVLINTYVFALNPSKEYPVRPDEYGMDYKEVTINTEDSLQLKAWFFKSPNTSYKIMILSDDGNGNMADLIEIASYFLTLNYNVLTYDYRGYGESSDFKINKNFYIYSQFEKDISAAINYVKKDHPDMPQISLYGTGIGAALSICAGINKKIEKIIADSPYITLIEIQKKLKEKKFLDVRMPIGYNKIKLEPKHALESNNISAYLKGIMLIAGQDDEIYTPKDMKTLGKMVKNIPVKIYIAKKSTIKNTFLSDKEKYFAEIKDFLKEEEKDK